MKDAATLLALAERVEALTGPDRDVDELIAPLQGLSVVDEGHPIGRMCYDHLGAARLMPRYTASLDAAMTLVPETQDVSGERYKLESYATNGVLAPEVRASAWVPGAARVFAATPALALTAAALRAHAAIATGEGQSAVVGAHQPTGRSAGNDQMLPPTQPCG